MEGVETARPSLCCCLGVEHGVCGGGEHNMEQVEPAETGTGWRNEKSKIQNPLKTLQTIMGIEIRNIVCIFNISGRKKTVAMLMFNARTVTEGLAALPGPVFPVFFRRS